MSGDLHHILPCIRLRSDENGNKHFVEDQIPVFYSSEMNGMSFLYAKVFPVKYFIRQ